MANLHEIAKCPTGIKGLDQVLHGGLPQGRPTVVCGGAGCGKTLLAMEFLIRGALDHDEPGVFVSFEEAEEELKANVRSLGFDLDALIDQKKLVLDYVHLAREEIVEAGQFDLEGLFIRLEASIQQVHAKRLVLDTVEALFATLPRPEILRAELRRLFHWVKEKGLTTVVTGEQGEGRLTRAGIEEYVSDCVLFLDHRVSNQVSTRRLRVVKYRGATHGHNEYPFTIDEKGIWVIPVTSIASDFEVSDERVSTGVPRLDAMLGGQGWHRGSGVLVSGSAGTGKSSLGAAFVNAACGRGEKALYIALEEPGRQIVRNMRSIGIDLGRWLEAGLLRIESSRPEQLGLEMHLAGMMRSVEEFAPSVVVVDPITSFLHSGDANDVSSLLVRLMDFLKARQITTVYNHFTPGVQDDETTVLAVSSLIDGWLMLRDTEVGGERNRTMCVLKARGTAHSNQIREFLLSADGIQLADVYTGPEGVLTGSARKAVEAREAAEQVARARAIGQMKRDLEQKRRLAETRIAALQAELEGEEAAVLAAIEDEEAAIGDDTAGRRQMASSRSAASDTGGRD